jgi:hypothetical protein
MDQPLALGTIPRSTRGSTRKGRKESKQTALHTAPSGLSGLAVRTVRDEPRGLSDLLPRTVRADVADRPALPSDRPLNTHRAPEATREKRTVRQARADRPRHQRTVRYSSADRPQTGCNQNQKPNRIENKGAQELDEHATNPRLADCPPAPRGRSARCGQSRNSPTPKVNSPNHHRISQTVEAMETRVWGLEKRHTRML